jgi:protein-ribulosamine 3-kinase
VSLLHGDLWSGNVLVTGDGVPALVDPAAYRGHREVDLAMMHLFGGFEAAVFEAYEAAWPLGPGFRERREPWYRLYPLLVHLHLFGAGYLRGIESAVVQLERS